MSLRGYLERKMDGSPALFDSNQSWWRKNSAHDLLWSLMQASMGVRNDQAENGNLGLVLSEAGEGHSEEVGNFIYFGGLKSIFDMVHDNGRHLGIENYGLWVPSPTQHDPERTQLLEQGKVFPFNQHVGLWVTEVGRERHQPVTVGLPVVSDELVGRVKTESLQRTSFGFLENVGSVLCALGLVSDSNLRVGVYHSYPKEDGEWGSDQARGGHEGGRIPRADIFDAVITQMGQDVWNPTTLGDLPQFTQMVIDGLTLDYGYTRCYNDGLLLEHVQSAGYNLLSCQLQEAYQVLVQEAVDNCDEVILLAVRAGMEMFSVMRGELGGREVLDRREREMLSNLGKLSVANTLLSVCLQHRIVLE